MPRTKRKYTKRATKVAKLFVAVVVNEDLSQLDSNRQTGDYSAFLGNIKSAAIQKALRAKAKWDGYVSNSTGEKKIYRVLAGQLSSEASFSFNETKL